MRLAAAIAALLVVAGGCSCQGASAGSRDAAATDDAAPPPDAAPPDAGPQLIQNQWIRTLNTGADSGDPRVCGLVISGGVIYANGVKDLVSFDLDGHEIARSPDPYASLGGEFSLPSTTPGNVALVPPTNQQEKIVFGEYDQTWTHLGDTTIQLSGVPRGGTVAEVAGAYYALVDLGRPVPQPQLLQLFTVANGKVSVDTLDSGTGYGISRLSMSPSGKLLFCGGNSVGKPSEIFGIVPGKGFVSHTPLDEPTSVVCKAFETSIGLVAVWESDLPDPWLWAEGFDAEGERVLFPARRIEPMPSYASLPHTWQYMAGRLVSSQWQYLNGTYVFRTILLGPDGPRAGKQYRFAVRSPSGDWVWFAHHGDDLYVAWRAFFEGDIRTSLAKLCPFSNPECYVAPPPADAAPPDSRPTDAAIRDAAARDAAPADARAMDAAPAAFR